VCISEAERAVTRHPGLARGLMSGLRRARNLWPDRPDSIVNTPWQSERVAAIMPVSCPHLRG